MVGELVIDPDITRAQTLPSALYHEQAWFERQRELLFPRTWSAFPEAPPEAEPGTLHPWRLLSGCLDEPLVLVRDEGGALRCLSNVCTHRGNLLVGEPCVAQGIRCRYHGRRFGLDGRFVHMPEFEDAAEFPSPRNDLPGVPLHTWGPLVFTSLAPSIAIDEQLASVRERVGFLPIDAARFDAGTSRTYEVAGNWALYCDNYLEGFHIPFVHPALNVALDYGAYETELLPHGVLQLGVAEAGEPTFELPPDHRDHGRRIGAYYFWLFPTTMLNFYPWGLSLNVVLPQGPTRTLVAFLSYVWDASKRDGGAGAGLHQVELEDEAVVEATQLGVRSRLYDRGRYSPTREQGVHHFHRMLTAFLDGPMRA